MLTSISGLSSDECDSLFCPIKNNGLISVIRKIGVSISFTGILIFIRLKVHPNVPNASLPNLTDFPNPNVPGLISKDPDVRKSLIQTS